MPDEETLSPLPPEQKIQVLKKIFSEDIESFGRFFFPHHLKLETPAFHRELYELYEDRSVTRIGIAAPRGHAKSTVTDLVYMAWEICNRTQRFILLVSDTYSQAALFLEGLKAEFESNDRLKAFYGDLTTQKWSEGEIICNGIMVKAVGAGMKVRGLKYMESRPTLVICDDLENEELTESMERRAKLERWFNGAVIPSLDINGRVIIIGTILHYDSLLAKIVGIDPRTQATLYREFEKRVYRAINDWGALWPEHLSIRDLDILKQDYMAKGQGPLFYQEYQNDPISDENRKFKLEKFKYFYEEEIVGRQFNTYITIDRAYSLDKTADATGIIVNSVDQDNNWYIRLAERFKGTEKDLIDKIFGLYSYFHPVKFGIEQKAFEYTIKPAMEDEMRKRNTFFLVDPLKDLGRSKSARIEGLVPRFEAGTVYIKRDMIDLIDELLKFPKAIHDDLSDALSYQLEVAEGANKNTASVYYPSRIKKTSYVNSQNRF